MGLFPEKGVINHRSVDEVAFSEEVSLLAANTAGSSPGRSAAATETGQRGAPWRDGRSPGFIFAVVRTSRRRAVAAAWFRSGRRIAARGSSVSGRMCA